MHLQQHHVGGVKPIPGSDLEDIAAYGPVDVVIPGLDDGLIAF
jgi:hypothetical protein